MIRNIFHSVQRQSNNIRTTTFTRTGTRTGTHTRTRQFGTTEQSGSIMNAWEKSCYHEMDYTISEEASVFEAVEKFSGYDVGALIAVDTDGKMAGVISERDYIKKSIPPRQNIQGNED
mmetsp:Transcript_6060/g.9110  ORF Transcript_6060/g.9110 Transcript_6060/m.9110 type:complete len:118 (-) Transcript_6060:629-982(-)